VISTPPVDQAGERQRGKCFSRYSVPIRYGSPELDLHPHKEPCEGSFRTKNRCVYLRSSGHAADVRERDEEQEEHLAVTRAVAARIAGLTERQLDYWAGTGLIEPSVDTRLGPGRIIRLMDLLALLIAAEPKSRHVSLQNIRAIMARLRSPGYASPLTQLTFATVGRNVYFQH
jgi:hypothetical protein